MRTMTILAGISLDWAFALILAGVIALVITLGRLTRRHGGQGDGGPASGRGVAEADERLRETAEGLMAEIDTFGREVQGRVETRVRVLNELLVRADSVASRLDGAEAGAGTAPPPQFDEVYQLADEGLDAAAIAARTSFECGEVDLILSLRRESRSRANGGGR